MDPVLLYNQTCATRYKLSRQQNDLERYVVSETLAPIEDYWNAIKLIKESHCQAVSNRLLIIGAHLITTWTQDQNIFLDVLRERQKTLSPEEHAIMLYLRAKDLRNHGFSQKERQLYQELLEKSMAVGIRFVYNRIAYKELLPPSDAAQVLREAQENVVHVASQEEICCLQPEQLADPERYIQEHILGTHISYAVFEWLFEESGHAGRLL